MTTNIKGKLALITGGSRGIGRAIALRFAQAGARVIINYASNDEEALKTIKEIESNGGHAYKYAFNVANDKEVEAAISKIKDELGNIDILVNNAGIAVDGLLMRVKSEDFDRQINVNLKGAFNCSKSCIRGMIKNKGGRIINISSVVGQMGNAGQSVYAAAKAGLIGMTKSLAKEFASRNVLVNGITPGYIATDMTKGILEQGGDALKEHIPLKRVGTPEDIASAALFLASDDASYITGHVLSVNGGLYM